MKTLRKIFAVVFTAGLLLASGAVWAQQDNNGLQYTTPYYGSETGEPGQYSTYAVVRQMQGTAYMQSDRDPQSSELTINTPVLDGDDIWTGSSGRLDVFLTDGNHIWLGGNSRVELDQLPDPRGEGQRTLRAHLWNGTMLLDVRQYNQQSLPYVIVTPSASISPSGNGRYLIEVQSVDRTRVVSLDGSCVVTSSNQPTHLYRNEMTYAEYGYPPTSPRPAGDVVNMALVSWSRQTEAPPDTNGVSHRYLPSSLSVYASEFDRYGSWSYVGTYGYVWQPYPSYLSAEWAPYMNGRWCYTPWGVTWVPYDVWGWAPFHYGRWVFTAGFGWGWVPGITFAPAWVAWYWGNGWLGWCPLGYYGQPVWGPSGWYSTNITNIYVHNVHHVVRVHRTRPNGNPILPPGLRRGHRGPITRPGGHVRRPLMAGGIHLSPAMLHAYRGGRINLGQIRRDMTQAPALRRNGNVGIERPALRHPLNNQDSGILRGGERISPSRRVPADRNPALNPRTNPGRRVAPNRGSPSGPAVNNGNRLPRRPEPPGRIQPQRPPNDGGSRWQPPSPPTRVNPAPSRAPDRRYRPEPRPQPGPAPRYDEHRRNPSPPSRPSGPSIQPRRIPSRISPPSRPSPPPRTPPPSRSGGGHGRGRIR